MHTGRQDWKNKLARLINEYRDFRKLVLATNPLPISSYLADYYAGNQVQVLTPLELALEILEPDVQQRGLRILTTDQLLDLLNTIKASLQYRGRLNAVQKIEKESGREDWLGETIIELRHSDMNGSDVQSYAGEDKVLAWELGLILNEFDLALEAWGCLDEAAVFGQASGIMQTNPDAWPGNIAMILCQVNIHPAAARFIESLKSRAVVI